MSCIYTYTRVLLFSFLGSCELVTVKLTRKGTHSTCTGNSTIHTLSRQRIYKWQTPVHDRVMYIEIPMGTSNQCTLKKHKRKNIQDPRGEV